MSKHTESYTIGIIGAMPQEIKTLTKKMVNIQHLTIANMLFYSGNIDNQAVVILQCGIGKVNAAIGTTLMIHHFNPSYVINTGSAGGLSEKLSIGDVVISQQIAHHDIDVTAFGYQLGQMAGMPHYYKANEELIDCAIQAADHFPNANIFCGDIVSGDQFIASNKTFQQIKTNFPHVFAVEMEAAAIAQTCYQFNLPFVVIRAISDLANHNASQNFEAFIEIAGQHSANMVVQMIAKLSQKKH